MEKALHVAHSIIEALNSTDDAKTIAARLMGALGVTESHQAQLQKVIDVAVAIDEMLKKLSAEAAPAAVTAPVPADEEITKEENPNVAK